MDDWFVSAGTDNSESSLVDSTNHHFQGLRWSLVLAVSCRHFPSWDVSLYAVLAGACLVYPSKQTAQMYDTPHTFLARWLGPSSESPMEVDSQACT